MLDIKRRKATVAAINLNVIFYTLYEIRTKLSEIRVRKTNVRKVYEIRVRNLNEKTNVRKAINIYRFRTFRTIRTRISYKMIRILGSAICYFCKSE